MPTTFIQVKPTNETIPANAIYASPNGASTAAGTAAAPCNIASAIGKVPAGGTVVLTGTYDKPYRVSALTLNKPIRFVAASNSSPVLSGAKLIDPASVVAEAGTGLYYIPHTSALNKITGNEIDPNYPFTANKQQLFVNYNKYNQVGSKSALTSETFYYQEPTATSTGRIYVKDNLTTAGLRLELTDKDSAILFQQGSAGSSFVGIGFEKYGLHVALCQEDNVTFDRCTIAFNAVKGITAQYCSRFRVAGCLFTYNGLSGLNGGSSGSNWIIEDNELSYNNCNNFSKIYNAAAMKIVNSHSAAIPAVQNMVIRDNNVHHNNSHGIWLDVNCNRYKVYRNRSAYNMSGIFFEISGHPDHPSWIVNNLCYQNAFGLYTSHSCNALVWNNSSRFNGTNLKFKDDGRVNENPDQVALGYDYRAKLLQFVNNILDTPRSSTGFNVDASSTATPSTTMVSQMHHNAYLRTANTQGLIKAWRKGSLPKEDYNALTVFKADNPTYEAGSMDLVQTTNPFYTSATNHRPKADSPAKGKGAAVNDPVVAELLGVPVGTVVDMGALFLNENTVTPAPDPDPAPNSCETQVADAIADIQADLALTSDNLRASEAKVAALTTERDQLKATNANLVATNIQLTADKAQLTNTVQTLQTENASLEDLNAELNIQVANNRAIMDTKLEQVWQAIYQGTPGLTLIDSMLDEP